MHSGRRWNETIASTYGSGNAICQLWVSRELVSLYITRRRVLEAAVRSSCSTTTWRGCGAPTSPSPGQTPPCCARWTPWRAKATTRRSSLTCSSPTAWYVLGTLLLLQVLFSDAKVANRNAKVGHGATENGPLNDGQIPNFRGVRVALGTGCDRAEGNRRASRNGRVSSSPPLRFATFHRWKALQPMRARGRAV